MTRPLLKQRKWKRWKWMSIHSYLTRWTILNGVQHSYLCNYQSFVSGQSILVKKCSFSSPHTHPISLKVSRGFKWSYSPFHHQYPFSHSSILLSQLSIFCRCVNLTFKEEQLTSRWRPITRQSDDYQSFATSHHIESYHNCFNIKEVRKSKV